MTFKQRTDINFGYGIVMFNLRPSESSLKQFKHLSTARFEHQQNPLSGKFCQGCLNEIRGENFLKLEDSDACFHIDHFNCKACEKNLSEIGYYYCEESIFCEGCFGMYFLPQCSVCQKPIQSDFISSEDMNFHRECFKCTLCSSGLDEVFYFKNAQHFCSECVKKELDSCYICKMTITEDKYETVDGISFHKDCLKCSACGEILFDDTFVPYKQSVYHVSCYKTQVGVKCFVCSKPIDGQYYSHLDKNLHFECIDRIRRISVGF